MNNFENNEYGYEENETKSLKDYLLLIRNNLVPFLLITAVCIAASVFYALTSKNIYESETVLKISEPQGDILEAPLMPDMMDMGMDRFIANEIEIIKSYTNRERVAEAVIDSFKTSLDKNKFYLAVNRQTRNPKSLDSLVQLFGKDVSVEQKRGLDIVDITSESPSPYEAELIANCYAEQYRELNLEVNRNQLTFVKNFLKEQEQEKMKDLNKAEDSLRAFQEKGGIVALDEQANALIEQLSQFEAKMNAAKIDYMASSNVLKQYKDELKKQDPRMADYLASMSSEDYINALQKSLAELQINKDLAFANTNSKVDVSAKVKEYDRKINDLKQKLNQKMEVIKAGIFASSPEEVKGLSQKIIVETVKNDSLNIIINGLKNIVDSYEKKFNHLPRKSIELASLKRNSESLEKLYSLIEEKYQDALINEQSQPGNVLVVDKARIPLKPAKPNRLLIILIGFVLGGGLAFGYVLIRDYFDDTIKTPEDIQKKNINILAWIPRIEGMELKGSNEYEFIVSKKPKSIPSEAFRALRTRVQFSNVDVESFKTILITSCLPQEGKTLISMNLAGSFGQAGKRVLLVDCDLRKPRLHTVFGLKKHPGLVDYLFNRIPFEDIIHSSEVEGMSYIFSGTIPPNPAEVLQSKAMKNFLDEMRRRFDIIVLDSPPIISVTDSEILSRVVDGTILVVSAESTEVDLMTNAVGLIKNERSPFLGVVLNNFVYKNGYGSYYKYYYYYSHPANGNGAKKTKGIGE
ncbi:MAG: polysaccharide biosynthesis tyrosine autokinase [Ignavibacteriaceae bacterium]